MSKPISWMICALLFVGFLAGAIHIQSIRASPGTIYIRANGLIDGTDKIITSDNVTYSFADDINGSVVVQRSNIVIDGNGRAIWGPGDGCGFHLTSVYNVTIKRVHIENFVYGIYLDHSLETTVSETNITDNEAGIEIYLSSDSSFSGNNITNNYDGISLDSSSANYIFGNNITPNGGYGIRLYNSSTDKIFGNNITGAVDAIDLYISDGNNITGNTVTKSSKGIFLEYSSYNIVSENAIINNSYYGIILKVSTGNILSSNDMTGNDYNLGIYGIDDDLFHFGSVSLSSFLQDIDSTNTIDGKPIYYWVNQHMKRIPDDAGFVAAINCTEITVSNIKLAKNVQGILFAFTSNSALQNLTTIDNEVGIQLVGSDNNTITANNATKNQFGISLYYSSRNNFTQNIVKENDQFGVGIGIGLALDSASMFPWATIPSEGNLFKDNLISNNNYWRGLTLSNAGTRYTIIVDNNITNNRNGIYLREASNNSIYHNNFINNNPQVHIETSGYANFWDNGVEGNYWKNYTGVDSDYDGIGDGWYEINSSNIDHYPLMGAFSDFKATSEYHVQTICNSSISNFQFNSTAIKFNVSGKNGTNGFCRICIPTALMNGTHHVFVNGTEVSCSLLSCSNSTYSYLYFNYTHSTQEVIIIPEFPSFLILPLFMIATLLAVTVYRRRMEN